MSRSKNTIKKSDASSTPIKVKYSATYASQSLIDYGITTNRGIYYSTAVAGTSNFTRRNNYSVIRQLYYQNYLTGSVIGSASYWDSSLQSTAASGTFDDDNRYFPSATGSNISFFSIPRMQFGEQIGRKSLRLSSTDNVTYNIIDDGNGNIIDTFHNNVHVGNILYAQGIITITNSDYIGIALVNQSIITSISIPAIQPSPTKTPSATPSLTATPSVTPTSGLAASPSRTPSVTPSLTPSLTPSKTPSKTATPSITGTPSLTPTKSISATPSKTPSATNATTYQATINVYGYNDTVGGFVIANDTDMKRAYMLTH